MDKKQREAQEARRRQEDIALQRGLLWVAGAVALEALLVLINRFYFHASLDPAANEVNIYLALHEVFPLLRMALPVAAVLGLLWMVWMLKQKKKYGLPLVVTIALAALTVCVHVIVKFETVGMSMLYWLVIAWAVLAMVFSIYQREFFLGASACGMSVLGLWFARYGAAGRMEGALISAAIVVVSAAALWMKKNDGALPGKEPVQFLPKKTNYAVLLVTCLVSLAAVVVSMLAGDTVAYYLMFVMVAWLFALFVYYTVKLM